MWIKILTRVVSTVLALFIAGLIFLRLSPDYNMFIVRSGSMTPVINVGDMIITGPVSGPINGEVKPGRVITYKHGPIYITHRTMSVDGDNLTTKGDAVEGGDAWPVSLADVKGVYLTKIPNVGLLTSFIGDKRGWFLVIILPAILLVALLFRDIVKGLLSSDK